MMTMLAPETGIPRLSAPDSTLALLREGYTFISSRCDRLGTDAFRTRLMLAPAVCMRGAEAAAIVYGRELFGRERAIPKTTVRLLQDKGSVQQLNGPAHHRRKAMFMGMMGQDALERARAIFEAEVHAALPRWQAAGRVVLHNAIREVLTRTACAWTGVPLPEAEVAAREQEFSAMIDNAGTTSPFALRAHRLRDRSEAWARTVIDGARSGGIAAAANTPLRRIADHADEDGRPLDRASAAVELLNVLRPIVAVGRFIVFAAQALAENPEWRTALASGDDGLEPFVQEVRRVYPFFPMIGGRALAPFEWHGHAFAEGDWVLLDLYGTNRDARIWDEPSDFRPERFRGWRGSAYTLIPQGAGPFETDHRCPGEWLTIVLMKEAVRLLTRAMRFEVPEQDLGISLASMPALPRSGVVLTQVRPL